jgi:hypothetical protein
VLRIPAVLAVGVAAILIAGCSSQPQASLDTYSVGPPGHQLRIAAAAGQHLHPAVAGGSSAGTARIPGALNYSTILALPDHGVVRVDVSLPTGPVAPALAHSIIHDFFNNVPERLTTWHGLPADIGVQPCGTGAGPCPGYIGGLQVFQSGVLYNVNIRNDSSDTAWAVIHSIRIPAAG